MCGYYIGVESKNRITSTKSILYVEMRCIGTTLILRYYIVWQCIGTILSRIGIRTIVYCIDTWKCIAVY